MSTQSDELNTSRTTPAQPVRLELNRSENRDAITDAPGSHPIGTGVGALAAGAAGAVAGSVVPGVGTIVGAAIGAVGATLGAIAGGLAGKAVAEKINPTDEHAFWRDQYRTRDYYKPGYDYDADYGPAYSTAVDSCNADPSVGFDAAEGQLRQSWETRRGESRLEWDDARSAMRDVYSRTRDRRTQDEVVGGTIDSM